MDTIKHNTPYLLPNSSIDKLTVLGMWGKLVTDIEELAKEMSGEPPDIEPYKIAYFVLGNTLEKFVVQAYTVEMFINEVYNCIILEVEKTVNKIEEEKEASGIPYDID